MKYMYGMTEDECALAKSIYNERCGKEIPSTIGGMRAVSQFIRNNCIDLGNSHTTATIEAKEFVKKCFDDAKSIPCPYDGMKFSDFVNK